VAPPCVHTLHYQSEHGPPNFLRQRATPSSVDWFADYAWKNSSKWYSWPPKLLRDFCSIHIIYKYCCGLETHKLELVVYCEHTWRLFLHLTVKWTACFGLMCRTLVGPHLKKIWGILPFAIKLVLFSLDTEELPNSSTVNIYSTYWITPDHTHVFVEASLQSLSVVVHNLRSLSTLKQAHKISSFTTRVSARVCLRQKTADCVPHV